jgi:PAS domain S-box-containing protein
MIYLPMLRVKTPFLAALSVLLLYASVPLAGQFFPRDSLLRELESCRVASAVRDSNYVRLLFLVARSYRPNAAQMRPFVDEARPLVAVLKSPRMEALLYLNIGNILRLERRFSEARDTLQLALEGFSSVRDSSNMSSTAGLLAVMYQQRDMFSMALQYYMRELEIADKCGDTKNSFLARANLSEISLAMRQSEKALNFARQAEPTMKRINHTAFLVEWCKAMAAAHRVSRNTDSALFYARKGVQGAWDLKDSLLVVNLMAQEVRSLSELRQFPQARQCLDSLLLVEQKMIQGAQIRPAMLVLATDILLAEARAEQPQAKHQQMLLNQALHYAERGLAHSMVSKKEMVDLYTALGEIYSGLGRTNAAFQAQRHLLALRDSVFTSSLHASIADMQERYALSQKESEIKILQTEKQRSTMLNLLLTVLAICGVFVAGISYHRYRSQQRSELALQEANTRLRQMYDEVLSYKNRIEEQNTALLVQESVLRESLQDKQLLAIVARYAAQIVIITDAEGYTRFVNDEFERISGYAPSEILGKKPGHLLQGTETDPATVRAIAQCIRQRKPFNGDIVNYTKDGRAYWIHLALTPVFDADNECEYFIGIQYDITAERQQQAKERQEAALTLQSMLDSAREITLLVGADFRMIQFNKAADRAMRGIMPGLEPCVGMDMRTYSPIPIAQVEKDFAEVMQGKVVNFDLDMPNPSKPSEILTFEVTYSPVRNQDGQIVAVGFVARNITHRRQIQEQIEQMNEWLEDRVNERTHELERRAIELSSINNKLAAAYSDLEMAQLELWSKNRELENVNALLGETNRSLEEASREKTEILGIVAHDLRSPLSGIQGLADVLQDPANAEYTTQIASEISAASERMFRLLSNLLNVNAIETGKMPLNLVGLAVNHIVKSITEEYQSRADAKDIRLELEMPEEPCFVIADESAFPQIIDNLVSNAIKYSPHGKTVRVSMKHTNAADRGGVVSASVGATPCIRIAVRDEGPGISEEDKKKLFGKFARLSAQPTGGEQSTGLGLSIVQKIVEAMHGRVWCESELGNGATFIVELPMATQPDISLV